MNNVYDLSDGRRLMLYEENNRVMVLFTPFHRGNMPGIRHNDCLGKLFSTVYNERIYYVYENFNHQIVFSCLEESAATVVLSPSTVFPDYERPVLREISGKLYLFYQVYTGAGIYELYMMDPWKAAEQICIYRGGSERLSCQWYIHEARQFMAVYAGGLCQALFLWSVEDLRYLLWTEPFREAKTEEVEAVKAECRLLCETLEDAQGENGRLCETLEAAQGEKERLKEMLEAARDENGCLKKALEAARGESGHLKEALEAAQGENGRLREMLEAAKKQYEELAETARKLQKIGRLWRDKYIGKPGGP